jgi:hypothetical protein
MSGIAKIIIIKAEYIKNLSRSSRLTIEYLTAKATVSIVRKMKAKFISPEKGLNPQIPYPEIQKYISDMSIYITVINKKVSALLLKWKQLKMAAAMK